MRDHDIDTLDLCRVTIADQVNFAISVTRMGHFNRQASVEHHVAVCSARWKTIEALIYKEQALIEQRERGEDVETVLTEALSGAFLALKAAEEQFEFYRLSHEQKGTPEADEKAAVNLRFRDAMKAQVDKIIALPGFELRREAE